MWLMSAEIKNLKINFLNEKYSKKNQSDAVASLKVDNLIMWNSGKNTVLGT